MRLLLAFIGLVLGLPTSLRSFVDEVCGNAGRSRQARNCNVRSPDHSVLCCCGMVSQAHAAYCKGWSAQLLVDQLDEEEFVQTRGIVPTVAGSNPELAEKVCACAMLAICSVPAAMRVAHARPGGAG